MNKKMLLAAILALLVLLTSCNSIPTTIEQIAPSRSPLQATATQHQENESVVLSSEQYDMIDTLLMSAMSMSGGAGEATFFQDAATLSAEQLLGFAYTILCDSPDSIGAEFMDTGNFSTDVIKDIIDSGLGVEYTPNNGDGFGTVLQYNGDSFDYEGSDDIPTCANTYRVTRAPSGDLLFEFNIITDGPPEASYLCNGEAVIQEDEESLFGYRIISVKKAVLTLAFAKTEASSCVPDNGSKTYCAQNVIDGDDNTAWAANGGIGEWITLTLDGAQDLTGLVLHLGDRSNDDAYDEHAMPLSFEISFSDGTSQTYKDFEVFDMSGDQFISFNRAVKTAYVKLTITDIVPGASGEDVFISEIAPF